MQTAPPLSPPAAPWRLPHWHGLQPPLHSPHFTAPPSPSPTPSRAPPRCPTSGLPLLLAPHPPKALL
eukprot:3020999-Rhodomonas_salina.1